MIVKVIMLLMKLGYDPQITRNGVKFKSNGFDNFKEEHKQKVRDLLGKNLIEFYYGGNNTQYVYFKN